MSHVDQFKHLMTLRPMWRGRVFLRLVTVLLCFVLWGCEGTSTTSSAGPKTTVHADSGSSLSTPPDAQLPPLSIDPLLPPGGDIRPPKAGETGRARTPEGLPILEPKGISADQLFTEVIKDPDKRMARLENAVVEIRKDLDAALPAINRLVAIEGDIQELVGQLQALTHDNDAPKIVDAQPLEQPSALISDLRAQGKTIAPLDAAELADDGTPTTDTKTFDQKSAVVPVPAPTPEATKLPTIKPLTAKPIIDPAPVSKPKAAPTVPKTVATKTAQDIKLSGIRLGDHDGKIRVVIDSAKPITMKDDLDLNEKLLVLDLNGADVATARETQKANDVIDAISLRSTGKGTGQAVFELKKDTKIVKTTTLPPTPENPNYRTVIDLEK